jgi:hypothetical protein
MMRVGAPQRGARYLRLRRNLSKDTSTNLDAVVVLKSPKLEATS